MTLRSFTLAALLAVPMIGSAAAEDAIRLTPPLYREQARTTAAVRPASELTTTPRPVLTVRPAPRVTTAAAMPTN